MIKAFLLELYLLALLLACIVGVIYSPIDKVLSMWIAGGILVILGIAGAWILREK